ncbi:hypothetical protein N0V90_009261 [Kalmusia sp. IMI 367209]|nr:hypothetical protein N0V90_009261 [Kalmusia sp. IMI 367209]
MRCISLTTCALLLISLATADKCAAPPLNLPYRNISITPGELHTGIPLQIGRPWQLIALVPSLQIDDTFVPRYTNTCIYTEPISTNSTHMNSTKEEAQILERDTHIETFEDTPSQGEDCWLKCAQVYGGAYNPVLSTTFEENRTNNQAFHYFADIWRFEDFLDVYSATNDALPVEKNLTSTFLIAEESKTFGGYGGALLGLTPNSTLLEALAGADMVPSTSWSLTNESLCLGCVDATAHAGDWHSFKPADRDADAALPCLIQAKVEALNWHPRAGVEGATLIQETFTACIDPGVSFLVLPTNATATFEEIVERSAEARNEDSTVFDGPPANDTGILTFRIEGDLVVNVSIPGAGDAGTEQLGDWTVPIGKGGWGAYGNQTWVLGKPFTDRVVLRWDGEKKEYGIANLNTDPARRPDIQPLGCDSFLKIERSVTSTPGTGILVGSIVGGFVGGLAFAFAGFWFFKRGRDGVKSKYAQLDEDTMPMRTMSSERNSWMSGALSPPPPSVHESLRSQMSTRARGQGALGLEVPDSQLYEAPEGGTAYPTKRERREL